MRVLTMSLKPSRCLSLAMAAALSLGMGVASAHAQKIAIATWGGATGATWRQAFTKPFQDETGIPVEVTEVPNPESSVRTLASKPQYNAALVTYFDAVKLYQDGLIEGFDAADLPELANIPEADRLKAPDGKLLGAPVYYTLFGIAFNTDAVKAAEVRSWKNLADPSWKDRIAISQPVWLAAYQLPILSYTAGGTEKDVEPGLPLFKSYAKNASVLYGSLAQLTQLLTRGEVEAAPFYYSQIWGMRHAGVKNVNILIPDEGALKLPYIIVVPKGSFDREAAKRWLNYVASAKPQERASSSAGFFPVNDKAKVSAEFESQLGMPLAEARRKMIELDWFLTARSHRERTDLVEKIIAETK
jgi:putative spermidine/putrescine transport system substrate-binding protein